MAYITLDTLYAVFFLYNCLMYVVVVAIQVLRVYHALLGKLINYEICYLIKSKRPLNGLNIYYFQV